MQDVTPNLLFSLSMHSRVLVLPSQCTSSVMVCCCRFHAQSCACPLLVKCHKGQIKTSHAYRYIKLCKTSYPTSSSPFQCTVVCLSAAAPEVDPSEVPCSRVLVRCWLNATRAGLRRHMHAGTLNYAETSHPTSSSPSQCTVVCLSAAAPEVDPSEVPCTVVCLSAAG